MASIADQGPAETTQLANEGKVASSTVQKTKKPKHDTNPAYAYIEAYPSTALSLARNGTQLLLSRRSHNLGFGTDTSFVFLVES